MDQRNLILAIAISAAIMIGWMFLQPILLPTPLPTNAPEQPAQQQQQPSAPAVGQQGTATVPGTAVNPAPTFVDRATALAQSPRVSIESPQLKGSIALKGGRVDDILLARYRERVDPGSPNIVLLSPRGAPDAYFAEFGWDGQGTRLPNDESLWHADGDKLTPQKPLTLTWDNGEGVRFTRIFTMDDDFMFTVTQRVENSGTKTFALSPYGRIQRTGIPALGLTQILYEGPIGVFGNLGEGSKHHLSQKQYHDVPDEYRKANFPNGSLKDCLADDQNQSVGGWLGITDKYWLVALVPDDKQPLTACFRWEKVSSKDVYQTDYIGAPITVAPAGKAEATSSLFTGAKEINLLDRYRDEFRGVGIPLFDRAVDFSGYFPGYSLALIAKPLFLLLDLIYRAVGNFGIAIMLLTVLVKAVFFPLANKSYRSMNKMKKLAPQMQELKARLGDDKARLNQEMMALYKKEKVNPAAGCLPILVQIPVFIALYQVLYVTIEMRHAPFFGWIKDLSAQDPTSLLNLFWLLPWEVPHGTEGFLVAWGLDAIPVLGHLIAGILSLLSLGVWPLVLGVTMFLQQKMNPPPPDPVQAKMFMLLPIVFTFMMAQFQAGLVIYWSWNNLLSITQQWLIKRLDERAQKKKKKSG